MKKWLKAALFVLPLLVMVAAVNWYVDSYAYLRVTYDEIAGKMIRESQNVVGLEESNFNDRSLLAACLKMQDGPKEVVVLGSSRVLTFEHTMFGTDSFYNAGLSESTIYDLLAVTGILRGRAIWYCPVRSVLPLRPFSRHPAHSGGLFHPPQRLCLSGQRQIHVQAVLPYRFRKAPVQAICHCYARH